MLDAGTRLCQAPGCHLYGRLVILAARPAEAQHRPPRRTHCSLSPHDRGLSFSRVTSPWVLASHRLAGKFPQRYLVFVVRMKQSWCNMFL